MTVCINLWLKMSQFGDEGGIQGTVDDKCDSRLVGSFDPEVESVVAYLE